MRVLLLEFPGYEMPSNAERKMFIKPYKAALVAFALLIAPASNATWSIVALNKETRTIAVAGASCSYMVYGIANVIPGTGVAVVQAASNAQARSVAASMMSDGKPLDVIMKRIQSEEYDPANQQYALLTFEEREKPLVFTGNEVEGSKGVHAGSGFSVQVNTMVSEDVLRDVVKRMTEAKWSTDAELAHTVMASLSAGASAGGDKRCEGSNSSSAFISLHKAEDHAQVPWLTLAVYGIEPGTQSAVDVLRKQLGQWLKEAQANPSTQVYVIPK
jgi:uncharacterized Ntn-hydrolase superfamily protein